jgi:uncharacterized membrane protein YhaH (DUF805 family)
MSFGKLFFSLNGRIGRGQFWLGTVVIWVVIFGLEWLFGVPIMDDAATFRLRAIDFAISLLTIYPTAAVAAKRLHDRDRSGALAWVLVAAFAVFSVGDLSGYFASTAPMSWPAGLVIFAAGVVLLAFLIDLGFRRGTPGPNQYGPDPVAKQS